MDENTEIIIDINGKKWIIDHNVLDPDGKSLVIPVDEDA